MTVNKIDCDAINARGRTAHKQRELNDQGDRYWEDYLKALEEARKRPAKIVDWDNALCCPACGNNYLHQGRVTAFNRNEDDQLTHRVDVDYNNITAVTVPSEGSGNPSPRRHGLVVEFRCETCTHVPRLVILQHKGGTYVEWSQT